MMKAAGASETPMYNPTQMASRQIPEYGYVFIAILTEPEMPWLMFQTPRGMLHFK